MTKNDTLRLARIRADVMKWIVQSPEAESWDNYFLLQLLDEARDRIKELSK